MAPHHRRVLVMLLVGGLPLFQKTESLKNRATKEQSWAWLEVAGEVVGVVGGGVVAVDAPRNTMEAVEEIIHMVAEVAEEIPMAIPTMRCT